MDEGDDFALDSFNSVDGGEDFDFDSLESLEGVGEGDFILDSSNSVDSVDERCILQPAVAVFQLWHFEFLALLLRRRCYLFFFFFLDHVVSFYNFFLLSARDEVGGFDFELAKRPWRRRRRPHVVRTWTLKKTLTPQQLAKKRRLGKKIYKRPEEPEEIWEYEEEPEALIKYDKYNELGDAIFRLWGVRLPPPPERWRKRQSQGKRQRIRSYFMKNIDNVFSFPTFGSFTLVELQSYMKGSFTMFNVNFFFKPNPDRVVYLFFAIKWWQEYFFLLYGRSQSLHIAEARYNNHVLSSIFWDKPLVRGALLRTKLRPIDVKFLYTVSGIISINKFAISLYFGTFILYSHAPPMEEWVSLSLNPFRLGNFVLTSHKSWRTLLQLDASFMDSHFFRLSLAFKFAVFIWSYIQRHPKYFRFTRVIGLMRDWPTLLREALVWRINRDLFWSSFFRHFLGLFLGHLWSSWEFLDMRLLEVPMFFASKAHKEDVSFFSNTQWWTRTKRINYFDYTRQSIPGYSGIFATHIMDFVTTIECWSFLGWVSYLQNLDDVLISHLFTITSLKDCIPFSYFLYISWAVKNVDTVLTFFPYERRFFEFFSRLKVDNFFVKRIFSFVEFFNDHLQSFKLFLRLIPSDHPIAAAGLWPKKLRFNKRLAFFFHMKDFFHKALLRSKLLALYFSAFLPQSSMFGSLSMQRSLFSLFSFSFFLKFRCYLSHSLGKLFVPGSWDREFFWGSLHQYTILRRHYYHKAAREPINLSFYVGARPWRRPPINKWYWVFRSLFVRQILPPIEGRRLGPKRGRRINRRIFSVAPRSKVVSSYLAPSGSRGYKPLPITDLEMQTPFCFMAYGHFFDYDGPIYDEVYND